MKHLLLLPAMLMVSVMSIAQLYVTPNDNGTPTTTDDSDSYIYVDNEILFVEQDIDLVINNVDPEFESSIYLRNEAQLFQGASNSLNGGSGYLSVYRENPGSDAWDYTFYGSPVGDNYTNPSAADGNLGFGARALARIIGLTESKQTFIVGDHEGFTDEFAEELYISHKWLYTKGAGHESIWDRMFWSNSAAAAQGFIMKGVNLDGVAGNHDFTYDFRGRPNNGTFNITVPALNGPHPQSITPSNPSGSVYQEILSGNPYPSALDLNRLFFDTGENDTTAKLTNSEITSILFWDEDRTINSHLYVQNKGGFGVWVPGGSDPNGTNMGSYTVAPFLNYDGAGNPGDPTGNSGAMYNRRFAPIGQGFYFRTGNSQVGDPSNMQISIRNQQRRFIQESSGDSEFRNTGSGSFSNTDPGPFNPGGPATIPNMDPQFRIYSYFDESHFRDMLLVFNDDTTDNYDWGWDAPHQMDGVGAEAYFPIYNIPNEDESIENYVIQALPFHIEKKVPYGLILDQQTHVVVQAVEEINTTSDAYLWDSQENTYQKINGNSTASMTLPAGDYPDRFFITFLNQAGWDTNPDERLATRTATENVDFFQNNTLAQLEVMNPEGYEIEFAHIFDMSGKLVQTRTDMGTSKKFTMNTATFADGVYLVKLVTADNIAIDYKAIVHNKR